MPRKPLLDATVLQAALEGLERQRTEVEKRIATVRAVLGARKLKAGVAAGAAKPKRTISPAGRRRIAAAQRKRWAELKAQQTTQAARGHPKTKKVGKKPPKREAGQG